MLGAIIGDTVGSIYEFNNTRNIEFPLFTEESEFTDDSILAAAVTAWAMSDKTYGFDTLEAFLLDFVRTFPNPMGGYGTSFEDWAFRPESLHRFGDGVCAAVRQPYHSYGNGAAMRAPGIGWLCKSKEEIEQVARISAAITHDHPEGIKGAQATAMAVYLARMGASKLEIKDEIEQRYGYDLNVSWEHLHKTYRWDSSCQGTVPQALVAFLASDDFESAIRMAVAIGGDSDTLACITGGVAEAFYQEIPEQMVDFVLAQLPPKIMRVLRDLGNTSYAPCFEKNVAPRLVGLSGR